MESGEESWLGFRLEEGAEATAEEVAAAATVVSQHLLGCFGSK